MTCPVGQRFRNLHLHRSNLLRSREGRSQVTTPETERRVRSLLWLLVVLLLAVVAAFLVYRWLDDGNSANIAAAILQGVSGIAV